MRQILTVTIKSLTAQQKRRRRPSTTAQDDEKQHLEQGKIYLSNRDIFDPGKDYQRNLQRKVTIMLKANCSPHKPSGREQKRL